VLADTTNNYDIAVPGGRQTVGRPTY
jgi:hypothetical protein